MNAAEPVQLLGLKGVSRIKTWLESTTWLDVPFNCYENEVQCTLPTLGKPKLFDLKGRFRGSGDNRFDVVVECKNYSSAGVQGSEFKRFLAIAYSHAVWHEKNYRGKSNARFFWVTSHPFSLTDWARLRTKEYVQECIEDPSNADLRGADAIDSSLVADIADRIWLLVVSEQQHELSMTTAELGKFLTEVDRDRGGIWEIS